MKFEKGSKEWCMFRDYWSICQKFWIPEDNDEYWESIVRETDEFYKKYKDIILAKGIILEFVNCLEKKSKNRVE